MALLKDLTSFTKSAKKPLIVILGATAAGKTEISLKIAHHINGEIISTDSRQIYQEMDIGNDIILPEEQDGVPHHMLAIAKPDETITLAEYKDMAMKIIDEIYERGAIPMLVGGTGLYISAIIEGYDVPRIPADKKLREKLEKEVKEKGPESIHKKLEKLDPEAAERIHPNNVRYVIRAIEVASHAAKRSDLKKTKKKSPSFDTYMIGIKRPREEIYQRINDRVDQGQVQRGLVEEVRKLVEKGYDENLPAMSSLGVKEIIPYIKGEMPLEECLEILKRNTRRYAKRQTTWLKRYKDVNWLTTDEVEKVVE